MDQRVFEELVAAAVDALPAMFVEKLENVEIVIEPWADRETLRRMGIQNPAQLLGFYHGVPRTQRTRSYTLVLPDKISLYRWPIEMRCRTLEEIQALIERVLRHEIAHHFGIDDERLQELDVY